MTLLQSLLDPSSHPHEYVRDEPDLSATDANGRTALHLAAADPLHRDLVAVMLHDLADPDIRDHEGISPLGYAVASGDPAVVERLLQEGADPDSSIPGGTSITDWLIQNPGDRTNTIAASLEYAGKNRSNLLNWTVDSITLLRPYAVRAALAKGALAVNEENLIAHLGIAATRLPVSSSFRRPLAILDLLIAAGANPLEGDIGSGVFFGFRQTPTDDEDTEAVVGLNEGWITALAARGVRPDFPEADFLPFADPDHFLRLLSRVTDDSELRRKFRTDLPLDRWRRDVIDRWLTRPRT